jgi:hypothetical protein
MTAGIDVIDINGKARKVEYAKRVLHRVPDGRGVMHDSYYVEVVLIGRHDRRWKEWWPFDDFMKANPGFMPEC